jgi:hypothetical protein
MVTSSAENIRRLLMLEPIEIDNRLFSNWAYETVRLPASEVDAASMLGLKPDVIFAEFSPISTVLFETIRVLEPYPLGPLLVFLIEKPTSTSAADVCLSRQNPEPVLATMLRARDSTREFYETNQSLLKANHEIKQDLHRERLLSRMNSEHPCCRLKRPLP